MRKDKVEDAFGRASADYDKYRKQAVPLMDEYYNTAIELTRGFNKPKILDLGAGTGILAQLMLEVYPDSEYTLLDLSEEMLKVAENKFKNLSNFKYVKANYITYEFKEKYDIVISSLSIHHLEDSDKKILYRKVYNALNSNGIFINADEVIGTTDKTEKMYQTMEDNHLYSQDIPEAEKDMLHERRKLDKPSTMADTIKWFEEIGFNNVDVFYKYYRYYVIYGEK